MTQINDGGPAFPRHYGTATRADRMEQLWHGGMSLRDWFAGTCPSDIAKINVQSDAELLAGPFPQDGSVVDKLRWNADVEAALRGIYADAMLAERSKKGTQ